MLREGALLFSLRADHRGPGGAPHESDGAWASEGKGPRPRPRPLDKAAEMQIAAHVVKGDAHAQGRTYVHCSGTLGFGLYCFMNKARAVSMYAIQHALNEPVPLVHRGRPRLGEMHP